MEIVNKTLPGPDVRALLLKCGITPTAQRLVIAKQLLSHHEHYSAEEVFHRANREGQRVSKATVYNALGLFAEKGLIRQVIVNAGKVFYDSNTGPHHHFYDVVTGQLSDIDANKVTISDLPPLPDGKVLEGVDVIVRLK